MIISGNMGLPCPTVGSIFFRHILHHFISTLFHSVLPFWCSSPKVDLRGSDPYLSDPNLDLPLNFMQLPAIYGALSILEALGTDMLSSLHRLNSMRPTSIPLCCIGQPSDATSCASICNTPGLLLRVSPLLRIANSDITLASFSLSPALSCHSICTTRLLEFLPSHRPLAGSPDPAFCLVDLDPCRISASAASVTDSEL